MEYTYTVNVFQDNKSICKDVTMKFAKVLNDVKGHTTYLVEVFDNVEKKVVKQLVNDEDVRVWKDYIEGKTERPVWDIKERLHELEGTIAGPVEVPPVKKDPSNPDHYKHYMKDMQWLEVILEVYKHEPEKVLGFLEIQISKYLSRIGKKDPYLQDSKKLRWYSIFLTAYVESGCKPIKIDDYPALKG